MGLKRGLKIFQPCMGFYLQGSVKALSVVEIGAQLAGIAVILYDDIKNAGDRFSPKNKDTGRLCAIIFTVVYCYIYKVVSIILAITLYISATKRNRQRLQLWLLVSLTMFLIFFSCIIVNDGFKIGKFDIHLVGFSALVIYKIYSFWVVYCFIQEIKRNGDTDAALGILSDPDLEDFLNGTVQSSGRNSFLDMEIPQCDLAIDKSSPLGSGAFGIVYKASLQTKTNDAVNVSTIQTQIVAVKTVPKNANGEHFKCLLRELQILNYVGQHENIVSLIGACTAAVKERVLYVVVEFCGFGSLLSYLRSNRDGLRNEFHWANYVCLGSDYVPRNSDVSYRDLLRWSMETATGMEYIASKNVIHGDLSAKNVLISFDRTAKIADFGLSKQLYRCTTYTKQGNVALPWRYLAVESLCDLKFSTSGDVWSYGILGWEIFSGGETPYPGLEYTAEFVEKLKNGQLQPSRPQYASPEIYEELRKCWKLDPKSRPLFQEIRIYFEKLLNDLPSPSQPICSQPSTACQYDC